MADEDRHRVRVRIWQRARRFGVGVARPLAVLVVLAAACAALARFTPGVTLVDLLGLSALIVGAAAARFGDEPEQTAALALVAAALARGLVSLMVRASAFDVPVSPGAPLSFIRGDSLAIEAWLLLSLVWLGLYANRGWTLVAGALQMVSVGGRIALLVSPARFAAPGWKLLALVTLLEIVVVGLGLIAHQWRLRRIGHYPAWRAVPVRPNR